MKNLTNTKYFIRVFLLLLLPTLVLINSFRADSETLAPSQIIHQPNNQANTQTNDKISQSKADIIAVTVVNIKQKQSTQTIKNSGRISFKNEMQLSFKTGGLIKQIKVEEGDKVKQGQILALLDLEEIDAQQKRAASNFERVAADLDRFSQLYEEELVSLQIKQNAQSAFDAAQAELQIADFNKKLSVIRAPVEGRILKRYVEANELLTPGQSVFLLASHEQGSVVRIGLIDQDIVKVAIGNSASVALDAYPGKYFSGKVTEVALSTDSLSGTFEVEVSVENNHVALHSGLIARVEITPTPSAPQFYIPIESVLKADKGMATIFLLNSHDNIVNAVEVKIIDILTNELIVLGDLKPTDKITKLGTPYLYDGRRVKVVENNTSTR